MMHMSGTVRLSCDAPTIQEAKDKALEQWRDLVNDREAELPWDCEFEIFVAEESGMKIVSTTVTIELDDINKVLEGSSS